MPPDLSNPQLLLDKILETERQQLEPGTSFDEAFELFVSGIAIRDAEPSADQIASSIVDSGTDGGIDAVWLLIDGHVNEDVTETPSLRPEAKVEVVLVQSTTTRSWEEKRVRKIADTLGDLLQHVPKNVKEYDERLLRFFERFHQLVLKNANEHPQYSFRVVYACRARQSWSNAPQQRIVTAISDNFPKAPVGIQFLAAPDLWDLHQKPVSAALTLKVEQIVNGQGGGWLSLVRLSEFNRFLRNEKGALIPALFDENVREHSSEWGVNKEISATLRNEATVPFWWLNNGITVIADKIGLTSSQLLTFDDPRIVNGLQTSYEIASHFDAGGDTDDLRLLLVRAIETTDEEVRDRIIRATNSQTAIAPGALLATTPLQKQIEAVLRLHDLYYERRKNQYAKMRPPRGRLVTRNFVAQSVLALLLERPADARARVGTVLAAEATPRTDDAPDTLTPRVFSDKYPIEMYATAVMLMRRIDAFLASRPELTRNARTNLRFHLAYMATLRTHDGHRPSPLELRQSNVDNWTDEFLSQQLADVAPVLESLTAEVGSADAVAKGDRMAPAIKQKVS